MEKDIKLIQQFLDKQFDETQQQEFEKRLRQDKDFLDLFLDYMEDEALTSQILSEDKQIKRFPQKNWLLAAVAVLVIGFIVNKSFFVKPDKHIAILKGTVLIERRGEQISENSKVFSGDLLRAKNECEIAFNDGSRFSLKPGCVMSINVVDDQKNITLSAGEFDASVKKQLPGKPMIITTHHSKATVLGTVFTLKSGDSDSSLHVDEGAVAFNNKTGSSDTVKAGEYAEARSDRPVIAIKVDEFSHNSQKLQSDFKRWSTYSRQLRQDPDMVVYYDYQDVSETQQEVLKNSATATAALGLDGEIITTMPLKGRWPQKQALYYSEYGYVNCGNDKAFNLRGPLSLFAWIKVKKFYRGWQAVIAKGDSAWRLARDRQNNAMEFAGSGLQSNQWVRGTVDVNDNQWHLVCGVYDGETIKLYVDGKLDRQLKASGKIKINESDVMIGANVQRPNRDFEGWIDELGIMKRALSAEEVLQMYEAGKP